MATPAVSASAWERRWPAPAKLNLFLHVVGRRDDGYHLLQTVFRLIDLCDTLEFAPRADGAVRLAAPLAGVPEDDDLAVRAARALQGAAGVAARGRRSGSRSGSRSAAGWAAAAPMRPPR